MEIRFVTPTGVEECRADELSRLIDRPDGFVWVDVPAWDSEAESVLREVFDFHPMAVRACAERSHTASVHGYPGYAFLVLHSPEVSEPGHVHLLELDQFIGDRFLVTVHGPINPAVPLAAALQESDGVLQRMESGRFRPATPSELSYAIGSAIVRRQRALIAAVAERGAAMEQRVMCDPLRNPEPLLAEMFLIRQELLTVRTMAVQGHQACARMLAIPDLVHDRDRHWAADLVDQFERLTVVADGEREFVAGVIDLYQTRVSTKMTVAMERLAVLAAVTLPITALASIYGMNLIANDITRMLQLSLVVAVMAVVSGLLLRWTKRQGWW